MKKCSFYRTIYGGVHKGAILKKTEGFCEELTDNNGNKFTMCYHKTPDGWIATERSTFCRICKGRTKKSSLPPPLTKPPLYGTMISEKFKQTFQAVFQIAVCR